MAQLVGTFRNNVGDSTQSGRTFHTPTPFLQLKCSLPALHKNSDSSTRAPWTLSSPWARQWQQWPRSGSQFNLDKKKLLLASASNASNTKWHWRRFQGRKKRSLHCRWNRTASLSKGLLAQTSWWLTLWHQNRSQKSSGTHAVRSHDVNFSNRLSSIFLQQSWNLLMKQLLLGPYSDTGEISRIGLPTSTCCGHCGL